MLNYKRTSIYLELYNNSDDYQFHIQALYIKHIKDLKSILLFTNKIKGWKIIQARFRKERRLSYLITIQVQETYILQRNFWLNKI